MWTVPSISSAHSNTLIPMKPLKPITMGHFKKLS